MMLTVDRIYTASLEIKKSSFIAYLAPYSQFDSCLENLRSEHKKSRHIVWAYRHLNEFNQVVENSTDDGEPKNTSGKPTLKVLQGNDLINTVVFTVRYFGGVKLGTGGLVRAYTDAAAKVIDTAEFIDLSTLYTQDIAVYYTHTKHAEHIMSTAPISIIHKDYLFDTLRYTLQGKEADVLFVIDQIMKFNR